MVDLTGAEPYQGAPTNADLTGADLRGTDLVSTNLSAAIWSDTIRPGGTNSQAYGPQTCVGHQDPLPDPEGDPSVRSGLDPPEDEYDRPRGPRLRCEPDRQTGR